MTTSRRGFFRSVMAGTAAAVAAPLAVTKAAPARPITPGEFLREQRRILADRLAPQPAFDPEQLKAEIEQLVIHQGPRRGENFKVLPWQMEVIEAMAHHRETFVSTARANGKSTLAVAIACSAINPDGCLFVPGKHVLMGVPSRNHQGIVVESIIKFLSPYMPSEFSHGFNTHRAWVTHRPTDTTLLVIGSDCPWKFGLQPTLVIGDEPATWRRGGRDFYGFLQTHSGFEPAPRTLLIGTRPKTGFFEKVLAKPGDDAASIVHAATTDDVIKGCEFLTNTLKKANPSYNHFVDLRCEINAYLDAALSRGRIDLLSYRALRLNMGPDQVVV